MSRLNAWMLTFFLICLLISFFSCKDEGYQKQLALAQQGDPVAQFNLGKMYHNGESVPKDDVEAVKWLRKAAQQGYDRAQYRLGSMYYYGIWGVIQDYVEAAKWLRKAAQQGNEHAQSNLGSMYYNGHGVTQDYVEAHMWLNLAAAQGNEDARDFRDNIYAKSMTAAQIAEAQRRAREKLAEIQAQREKKEEKQ